MSDVQTTTRTKIPDASVKLPDAVARAANRANELSEEQRKGKMAFADLSSPTPPQVTPPQVTPPPKPAATPPAPAPAPVVTATPTATEQKTYSESEFKAMVGRFEKAQKEKNELLGRLNEHQRLLATVAPPADVRTPPPAPYVKRTYVTPEEEKEWSAELLATMRKAAREVVEEQLAPVVGEVQQVKRSLGGVQANIVNGAQQEIYQKLDAEVPDWTEYNNKGGQHHEGFMEWANQLDPLSGNSRIALLQDAFTKGQASRVVAAFKGYKAELATLSPAQTQRSPQGNGAESAGSRNATDSQSNPATTPAVDLASLAAPGRARPGQVPTSPDKPIVTGAEIAQFYSDVTRGKYAGREDEYKLIERQIQEALQDGRVRR